MLSYFIFSNKTADIFISNLGNLNYLGAFIAGLLFSFGFTTPFAIGYFITLNSNNIFILAIIGGFGALLSDLLIYKLIKMSFMSEFYELEKTKTFKELKHLFTHYTKHKIRIYLLYIFSGIIIASPLPDEIGVTMLAGITHIKTRALALTSFLCNTIGILIILFI